MDFLSLQGWCHCQEAVPLPRELHSRHPHPPLQQQTGSMLWGHEHHHDAAGGFLSGCHELAFFTFFSFLFLCIDTCCYSLGSYSNTSLHSLPSISPSNFASDHQRKSNSACIQSQKVANTMLRTTTDGPFQNRGETTRLSNCPGGPQDQRPRLGSENRHDRS